MSNCVILGDKAVHGILIDLSREAIADFLKTIEDCLISFSLADERKHQPSPGVVVRPNGQKVLFRPFTSPRSVGTKIIVDPAPDSSGGKSPLHGILALCDENGRPTGIINAEEVTGFRTSLSAISPFMRRRNVQNIVIFGAGKQALWHGRLALALRGDGIQSITVINRSVSRAESLLATLNEDNDKRYHSKATTKCIDPSGSDYQEQLAAALSDADVIFCTVPSTEQLFSASLILNESRKRGPPLITAIGSWQPDMVEVDPAILTHIVNDSQSCNPKGEQGGVIIVDDREGTSQHAGEILKAKLDTRSLVEWGEMLGFERGEEVWQNQTDQKKVKQWLSEGLVVYKSIGVSVTDLAAGNAILAHAAEKQIGTFLDEF